MIKTKLKYITISLLFVQLIGHTAYAAEDFFWSDAEPFLESCTQERTRGDESWTSGRIGLVIGVEKGAEDVAKVEMELPTCEEAMKRHVKVLVNGKYLQTVAGTGAEPFIENRRTMIPLRAIADAFGFEVGWEANAGKITLSKDGQTIILYIGKSEILVNGETVYFEGAVPMIKNSRTFLPASKLAEILGLQVNWDEDTRTATFTNE